MTKQKAMPVSDEAMGKKITVLDVFIVILTILISIIGYLNIATQNRIIAGQTQTNAELGKMREEAHTDRIFLRVLEGRTSRVELDVKKSLGLSYSNREEIVKLKGAP
jgi:regulator of extracellular matrix RemA (YlzA/DUF370 family)